ncbi:MAG: hypothetical protein QW666_01340 [Candidatus Woesearchaeota archaeon]
MMNIENSPTDRKLIVLEAYIIPFKNIEQAKEKYSAEINARIENLEKIVEKITPLQKGILDAIKNNDDKEYNELMLKLKEYYDPKAIDSLQKGIIQAIQTGINEKINPKERPTEPIRVPKQVKEKIKEQIAKDTEMPKEQPTAPVSEEMPRREYYQALIQKYNGKMYEIRQKIENNMAITDEEMDAWLAWFVQDLLILKKRRSSSSILQEERDFLKEHLSKWGKRPILYVYYTELKELGL